MAQELEHPILLVVALAGRVSHWIQSRTPRNRTNTLEFGIVQRSIFIVEHDNHSQLSFFSFEGFFEFFFMIFCLSFIFEFF